jgi:hypothetical protein
MRSAAISTAAGAAHEAADDSLCAAQTFFPNSHTIGMDVTRATAGQWNLRAAHAPDSRENTELAALIILIS